MFNKIEYNKEYRKNHPNYFLEYKKNNPEKVKKYALMYRLNNKEKIKQEAKKWRTKNPKKISILRYKSYIKMKYGISIKAYENLLLKQGYVCSICKQIPNKRLAIDHNHITGKIRGLLCIKCNSAIGFFGDNLELIKNAYEYLNGF